MRCRREFLQEGRLNRTIATAEATNSSTPEIHQWFTAGTAFRECEARVDFFRLRLFSPGKSVNKRELCCVDHGNGSMPVDFRR